MACAAAVNSSVTRSRNAASKLWAIPTSRRSTVDATLSSSGAVAGIGSSIAHFPRTGSDGPHGGPGSDVTAWALRPHSPAASSCPGEVELAPPAHRDGLAVPERWRIRAARDVPLDRLERAGRRLARHAHVAHRAVRADEIDRTHDAGDGLPLRNAGASPLA